MPQSCCCTTAIQFKYNVNCILHCVHHAVVTLTASLLVQGQSHALMLRPATYSALCIAECCMVSPEIKLCPFGGYGRRWMTMEFLFMQVFISHKRMRIDHAAVSCVTACTHMYHSLYPHGILLASTCSPCQRCIPILELKSRWLMSRPALRKAAG